MDDEEKMKKARARVGRLRSFYSNLITFIVVNVVLLVINLVVDPGSLWFYWVTLIWGVILIVQAFNTFTIRDSFLGDEWEKRQLKKLMKEEDDEDDS